MRNALLGHEAVEDARHRLNRIGGEISISRERADAYLAAYPIWQIARLAFREDGLSRWAECLGPDNWREAQEEALSANAYHAAQNAAAAGNIADVAIGAAGVIADGVDFDTAYTKARAEIIALCLAEVS